MPVLRPQKPPRSRASRRRTRSSPSGQAAHSRATGGRLTGRDGRRGHGPPPENDNQEDVRSKELEARLRHVHRIARLGSFERDFRTGGRTVSPEFLELLGITEDEFNALDDPVELAHPDDRERVEAEVDAAIRAERDVGIECRIPVGDTVRLVRASCQIVRDERARR